MGVLGIDAILDEQMMPAAKPEVPKQYLRWPFAAQRSAYDKHVENYNRCCVLHCAVMVYFMH